LKARLRAKACPALDAGTGWREQNASKQFEVKAIEKA
jgi:hypothetical protein